MKQLLLSSILLLTVMVGPSGSFGADFQNGMDAAQRGDFATALKEWKPLAEQGDAHTQYNLGVMYRKGRGITRNYKTAVEWYTRAADQEDASAQNNLGHMYQNGKGVPQDHAEAFKWYRLAANQGVADAQLNLGGMYGYGYGVIQDYARALMWWTIAASQGHETARKNRDIIEKKMFPADVSKAKKLAKEWMDKHQK